MKKLPLPAKIALWLALTAAFSVLLILKLRLYIVCQSCGNLLFLIPPALATAIVREADHITWNIYSYFFKRQIIR
ncbi:MAG TPA: hypothetical protein VFT06_10400 [Flavisolibacter sp.]|nr:hypothetical protein [Flavisolibacter sp.]